MIGLPLAIVMQIKDYPNYAFSQDIRKAKV